MPDDARGTGPLLGVRVLDLSRILAGPSATQLLGDLGADVIKVEKPGRGDDTRGWGPPFAKGADGERGPAAYFLAANRNKRSVAIDLATREGRELVLALAARADVFVENYKVGDLARYGLDFAAVSAVAPRLVYCSITGFGQTGPRAHQVGYDFVAQAMGGLMSLTGEPEGQPVKVGVGIADLTCGLYAAVAILAALRHRDRTGQGQQIDLSLLDAQVASLANEATNYLVSGELPVRRGNAHPNIVPYRVFETQDGHIVLAVGNDPQFERFCVEANLAKLATDVRFATNAARVANRSALEAQIAPVLREATTREWCARLERQNVPCSPVHNVAEALTDVSARARGMQVDVDAPDLHGGKARVVGNPIHLSATPVSYRMPPPSLGEHTGEVLGELGIQATRIADLRDRGIVG